MAQVQVSIGGRPYRLACSPGEEAHMSRLAQLVDARVSEMRGAFRDIDDQRIVVMAALGIADDLVSLKAKADALERETAARQAAQARVAELEAAIAETTARVEALAETLSAAEED